MKRLQESQLETLLSSVESLGASSSSTSYNCVLVQTSVLKRVFGAEPSLLTCQVFRWPEVREVGELKRLPECQVINSARSGGGGGDVSLQCCNPFHYARIYKPGKTYSTTRTIFDTTEAPS